MYVAAWSLLETAFMEQLRGSAYMINFHCDACTS